MEYFKRRRNLSVKLGCVLVLCALAVLSWPITILAVEGGNDPTKHVEDGAFILKELTFGGGGFNALKTDNGTYASDGTGDVTAPHWTDTDDNTTGEKKPICYTWESAPTISAKFAVPEDKRGKAAKIKITANEVEPNTTVMYNATVNLPNAAEATINFTADANNKLAKAIASTTFALHWQVSWDNGATWKEMGVSVNPLYVTAGAPVGNATVTRIKGVTGAGKQGGNDEKAVVDAICTWIYGNAPFGHVTTNPPPWNMLDGTEGDCVTQCTLMQNAIKLIGLTAGDVVFCYVRTDKRSKESGSQNAWAVGDDSARDCTVGHSGHTSTLGQQHGTIIHEEILVYVDCGGGQNKWEAAYKSTAGGETRYYGGGAPGFKGTVQELMEAVVSFTYWRYNGWGMGSGPCNNPPWGPGPYPETQWK